MTDKLNDEERSIVTFLETYFAQQGMVGALAMLRNKGTKIDDHRAVINGFRYLYVRALQ